LRQKSTVFDTTGYGEVLTRLARAGGKINIGMRIILQICKVEKLASEDAKEILVKTISLQENCGDLWRLIRKAFYDTPPDMAVSRGASRISKSKDRRKLRKDELTARAVKNCLSLPESFIGKCVRDLPRATGMHPSHEQAHNALVRLLDIIQNLWCIRLTVRRAATQNRSRTRHAARVGRRTEMHLDRQVESWLRHRQLPLGDIEMLSRPLPAAQG
jgi:hypothetical protein